jgi:hypothetical protein
MMATRLNPTSPDVEPSRENRISLARSLDIGSGDYHNLHIQKKSFQIALKIVHSPSINPMRVSEEIALGSSLLVEQKLV